MQVTDQNNCKVYNLSSGKSVPEWLDDRKRRLLLKKGGNDLRKRIELIQDFQMPGISSCIRLSPDSQYIVATGVYKPRVRCYDVNNLAMKFERCFDSEVITFEILSEDYSKMVFLQADRYIEFHSAEGRYYRLRMPKFGHHMKYHIHTCDLYLVGASSDIFRLNLERGQFLPSLISKQSTDLNKLAINPHHGLVMTGGVGGKLEAWDPRSSLCIATLDCALENTISGVPDITALNFNGDHSFGVGLSTGHVLLYDIRKNKPYRIKDHMYDLPILDVEFLNKHVLSMDQSIVKIWNEETGNLLTSIDAGSNTLFNNLCIVPNSGMMFIANENIKIQTYYVPILGRAPGWCSFLDSMTNEMEEDIMETVYDDYKFVTEKQLEVLGLTNLIGTELLRGYMHGYFMDIRLYRKVKSAVPLDFEKFKERKIKKKLDEEKTNRVKVGEPTPPVNADLAKKLYEDKVKKNKFTKSANDIINDERFADLFKNPDFAIDSNAEEYKRLTPVLKRMDDKTNKELEKIDSKPFKFGDECDDSNSDNSIDDDLKYEEKEKDQQKNNLKKSVKNISTRNRKIKRGINSTLHNIAPKVMKMCELNPEQEMIFKNNNIDISESSLTLGQRLERNKNEDSDLPFGNRTFSFTPVDNNEIANEKRRRQQKEHKKERSKLVRLAPKANNRKLFR